MANLSAISVAVKTRFDFNIVAMLVILTSLDISLSSLIKLFVCCKDYVIFHTLAANGYGPALPPFAGQVVGVFENRHP